MDLNDHDHRVFVLQKDSLEAEPRDGVVLAVEGVDDLDGDGDDLLDYVDDVIDNEELVELSGEEVPSSSKRARNNVIELTDKELANNPRVKSLFNQFWEEKMKELKRTDSGKEMSTQVVGSSRQERLENNVNRSPQIKSPSDTTNYAPTLKQKMNKGQVNLTQGTEVEQYNESSNGINQMISNFVDNIRLEQDQ